MPTEYALPPHNIEAKKGVISGALMDKETILMAKDAIYKNIIKWRENSDTLCCKDY